MSGLNHTTPLSDSRIVRFRRDHYEQIVAERDALRREVASLRALIQADGTLSKVILDFGTASKAIAAGLRNLSTHSPRPE